MARRGLGAYPEFIVLLAAVLAIGVMVSPKDAALTQVQPHPFYAVVLLIALRYGSPTGAIVGAICAGIQVLGYGARGLNVGEALHFGAAEIAAPLLYIVVGAVVGETVERQMRRADHMAGLMNQTRERLNTSEGKRAEMELAYRQVEGRIAGQTKTLISLHDSVKQLDSLEAREIYDGLVHVLRDQLGVDRCSIWLVAGDGSHRRIIPHDAPDAPLPTLGEAAVRGQRVVTVKDYFVDQDASPEDGLLAGLLYSGEGRVAAVVVVESLSFVGFTHRAAKQFEVLLDWASRSLDKAQRVASYRRRSVFDQSLDLTSELFLRTRAKADLDLAIRRGTPATVLVCRTEGDIPEEVHRRLILVFARVFRYQTRLSDAEAYFEGVKTFVLFLPEVAAQGARVVQDRLDRYVGEFDFHPYGDDARLALRWGLSERGDDDDFGALLQAAIDDSDKRKTA